MREKQAYGLKDLKGKRAAVAALIERRISPTIDYVSAERMVGELSSF
jgi:hypothetical protein